MFRTTLRLDPEKPGEGNAIRLLQSEKEGTGLSYGSLIAKAVNLSYGESCIGSDNPLPEEWKKDVTTMIQEEVASQLQPIVSLLTELIRSFQYRNDAAVPADNLEETDTDAPNSEELEALYEKWEELSESLE